MADRRPQLRRAALLHRHARRRGGHVGGAAPLGLRPLPLRRRQERGGGALFRHPHRPRHRRGLRHLRGADRDRGDLLRHVHPLDLALLARQFLRALRHRRGGARRLLAARRRGLDRRRRARRDPAAGAAEPRQPARHPELAQLRGDGLGHPDRRARRPAVRRSCAGAAQCGRRPRNGRPPRSRGPVSRRHALVDGGGGRKDARDPGTCRDDRPGCRRPRHASSQARHHPGGRATGLRSSAPTSWPA